jgi:methylated-DNA-[protein]-cysteine S-methyltransferase
MAKQSFDRQSDPLWAVEISQTPLGILTVLASSAGIKVVHFGGLKDLKTGLAYRLTNILPVPDFLGEAARQLQEYLEGKRETFELPLDWTEMSSFSARALKLSTKIPYGQTRTYGQLASALGLPPGAARAVGSAMAANPIPLILPCHRMVGSDGKLHGYSGPGGVETKAWLLGLEGNRFVA